MPDDSDDVGYRRPPKARQFKPGQSGNPSGRPKAAPSLKRELMEELAQYVKTSDGKTSKLTTARVIAKKLVNAAMDGDTAAIRAVFALESTGIDAKQSRDEEFDRELLDQFIESEVKKRLAQRSIVDNDSPIKAGDK